jgi:DNA (cytosine-5)-methyltransferase 1
LAAESDRFARDVYQRNWSVDDFPERVEDVARTAHHLDDFEVLTAGFPCQPFSKSGLQRGMEETRGTLFWSILKILQKKRPPYVLLENVRNLAGPRHRHEWRVIIRSLRDLGYLVSDEPAIFSPHLLPPEIGGTPQFRERIFIAGVYVGKRKAWNLSDVPALVENTPVHGWSPGNWRIRSFLRESTPLVKVDRWRLRLSDDEIRAVDIWDSLVQQLRSQGAHIPGFPLWADSFQARPLVSKDMPDWKIDFLTKNSHFYLQNQSIIDTWLATSGIQSLSASRRKLEWQAKNHNSLWETLFHFRPSGIRARPITYAPALVALAQTSVIGAEKRRISPIEAAVLQGFPSTFDFGDQSDAKSYQQLGNAVSVGVVRFVFSRLMDFSDVELGESLNVKNRVRAS